MQKVGIMTMEKMDNRDENSVGSSRIRARWLLPYWPEAEEFVIGKKYDIIIFQKTYWDAMMSAFDGIKILDLCDPDWLEGRDVFKYIDLCDGVVTSTEELATYIRKLRPEKPVRCIPDRLELKEHKPRGPHRDRAKSVVWFGYAHNAIYLRKTLEYLERLGLSLTVVSNETYTAPRVFNKLKVHNVPYSYPGVHEEIKHHDICLLPVPSDDERGKFKSNNKVLTAWALGVPVAQVPEDLERFLSPEERNKEQAERLDFVKSNYDVAISVTEYKEFIDELTRNHT